MFLPTVSTITATAAAVLSAIIAIRLFLHINIS